MNNFSILPMFETSSSLFTSLTLVAVFTILNLLIVASWTPLLFFQNVVNIKSASILSHR